MAFFTAYGIGANDVANAFATSVGSKALTLKQAIIIAGVFEFGGSVLLGSSVTSTIRKNIADTEVFADDPEVLMYGMLCVIAATGLWLILASYLELPVSTTHSVIGGIIGMSIAAHGSDAVIWYEFDSNAEALKKIKGVVPVFMSWVIAPLLSGVISTLLYLFVRTFVLRQKNSLDRAFIFFPFLVGITVAVNAYFVIYKGFKRKIEYKGKKQALSDILGVGYSSLVAWGLGALVGVILYFTFIPYLRNKIERDAAARADQGQSTAPEIELKDAKENVGDKGSTEISAERKSEEHHGVMSMVSNIVKKDLHSVAKTDETVKEIYDTAEEFDPSTEEAFKYLQVFTAMMDSFGHGANDVANSIGPFATIWDIYRHRTISDKADVPEWILVLGGAGIVVGLATYGYKIMRAVGIKLVKMSASRGFAIELGAAVVIVTGSRYGIPLSTTHCQVGSTVGVGLTEGRKGVNYMLLLKVIVGWVITLVIVGFTAAGFFAQGVYSPSIPNLRYSTRYNDGLTSVLTDMNQFLNGTDTNFAENAQVALDDTRAVFTDVSREQVQLLNDTWLKVQEVCA